MEIELKLALPPQSVENIRQLALLSEFEAEQHALRSIYFDTPHFALMKRAIAIRLRQVGPYWVQTMKADAPTLGAISSRPEWEMAIADGSQPDFSLLPPAALNLLHGIDLQQIAPVFITEFQRSTWQITRGDDHAELALDLGEIQAGTATQVISEIEIELKAGNAEFLFDIATQLLAHAPLLPEPLHLEPRSKAERGYVLRGAQRAAPAKSVTPEINRHQRANETWHAVMQAALTQCVSNLPGFFEQADDTEYLHQLRIAMRRLRAGVTLARSLGLPAPAWVNALREAMGTLNAARDWDVFMQETLPALPTLSPATNAPTTNAPTPASPELEQVIKQAHQQARQHAQTALRKPEFTQLILDIERDLLTHPLPTQSLSTQSLSPHPPRKKTPPARAWAGKILQKRWLTVRKHCRKFSQLTPAEQHAARIAAKKLRYAADAFAPLYGKKSTRFIKALANLQNSLGSGHDALIGTQLLHALAQESPHNAFALGRMSGTLEGEMQRRSALSSTVWQRLAHSKPFWRGKK